MRQRPLVVIGSDTCGFKTAGLNTYGFTYAVMRKSPGSSSQSRDYLNPRGWFLIAAGESEQAFDSRLATHPRCLLVLPFGNSQGT